VENRYACHIIPLAVELNVTKDLVNTNALDPPPPAPPNQKRPHIQRYTPSELGKLATQNAKDLAQLG